MDQRFFNFSHGNAHLLETDLDLDGSPEIISTSSSQLYVSNLDSQNYFIENEDTFFSGNNDGFRTIETQLDSNPAPDLVSTKINNSTAFPAIFLNPDPGTFGIQTTNNPISFDPMPILKATGIEFDPEGACIAIADLNGDNYIDIAMRGNASQIGRGITGQIITWLNDGNANFTLGTVFDVNITNSEPTNFISALDHDHDGDQDIVGIAGFRGSLEYLEVYENDGDGNFSLAQQTPLHTYNGLRPYWLEISDADADGFIDAIVLGQDRHNESELAIIYGSSTGLSTTASFLAGIGAAEVINKDINADGLPDLITCAYECDADRKPSLSIAYQISPRQYAPMIAISDLFLSALAYIDMNNDGVRDIVTTQHDSGYNPIYYSVPQLCPADLNLDRVLNFFDISLFLNMFTQERPLADLNRDGSFNFFDVSALFQSFQEGCP